MINIVTNIDLSSRDLKRKIKLPMYLTKGLAEILGVMIGDGHIQFRKRIDKKGRSFLGSEIYITGNQSEIQYMYFVINLFKKVFNVNSYLKKDPRSKGVQIRIYSKGIVQYFNKMCQLPIGNKNDTVSIPGIIRKSEPRLKYAFLRGLSDTDFSLTFKNKNNKGYSYPVIQAGFKSKNLIQDLEQILSELGFKYCVLYDQVRKDKRFGETKINCIYLNGKNNFNHWIKKVGTSNNKFQRKITKFQRDGVCPPGY